jgi:lactobin A/cerein 7B family class IIb bacteriocin
MNDPSINTASTDVLLLSDAELEEVNGGLIALIFGVLAISAFAGAWFGTMTGQLITALRNR